MHTVRIANDIHAGAGWANSGQIFGSNLPAKKTLQTRLVRAFYRLVAPKHPRGWIEMDWEEQSNGKLRLFTEGLSRFDLPDLEICDCPPDQILLGYCHGMQYVTIGALQRSKEIDNPIRADDIVDLRSTEDEEVVPVRIAPVGSDSFRLEDVEPSADLFPSSATATYILNAASKMRRPYAMLQAANLAAGIHAKDFDYNEIHPNEEDMPEAIAQSNAWAYYTIADALEVMRRKDQALEAVEIAVARAPFVAEKLKEEILASGMSGTVADFVMSNDPWEVQKQMRAKTAKASTK